MCVFVLETHEVFLQCEPEALSLAVCLAAGEQQCAGGRSIHWLGPPAGEWNH